MLRGCVSAITIGFQTKLSSDLDMGRHPKLKSDEYFVWNPIVIEISRCEAGVKNHSQQKKCCTFSELFCAAGEGSPKLEVYRKSQESTIGHC